MGALQEIDSEFPRVHFGHSNSLQNHIRALHVVLLAFVATLASAGRALDAEAAETQGATAEVVINVSSPGPGEAIRNKVNIASVRGIARSGADGPIDFDVMIAIDVSKSTQYPSGIDVDEDGEIGFNPHEELIAPAVGDVDQADLQLIVLVHDPHPLAFVEERGAPAATGARARVSAVGSRLSASTS